MNGYARDGLNTGLVDGNSEYGVLGGVPRGSSIDLGVVRLS